MIEIELIPDSIKYIQMDDERYFSKEFSNCISNSKLSLINPEQGGSKEKYLNGLGKNCSDSLVFGSAVHELVLQPDDFYLEDSVDRPTSKLGFVADDLYKKYSEKGTITKKDIIDSCKTIGYYANTIENNEDKISYVTDSCLPYIVERYNIEKDSLSTPIFLDEKSRTKCMECTQKVLGDINIQRLLHPETGSSENEAALFIDFKATDTETGKSVILRIKGKLDNFTIDPENKNLVLNDLKTTGHLLKDFPNSFKKFHYPRQMAIYTLLLKEYARVYHSIDSPNSIRANMLIVSTISGYFTGVYKVSKEEIEEGFKEFIELLKLAAEVELEKA
ncbi:PD-(D/E)XK nuclease family protein [Lachnospira sp.]|jgi:hypothetical protein|uniref:PD-(D/E)XK nuclease family protein n=1 Tax=Lachnospira sp. TaxID=2049031 RepID=UPI00257C73CF|nr:PD-(D/E)XK nuclease family protein [Lachnospira sp.]